MVKNSPLLDTIQGYNRINLNFIANHLKIRYQYLLPLYSYVGLSIWQPKNRIGDK